MKNDLNLKESIQIKTFLVHDEEISTINAYNIWLLIEKKNSFDEWIEEKLQLLEEYFDFFEKYNEYFLTFDSIKALCIIANNKESMLLRKIILKMEKEEKNISQKTHTSISPFNSTKDTYIETSLFKGKYVFSIIGKTKKNDVRIISFGYNKAIAILKHFDDIKTFVENIQ